MNQREPKVKSSRSFIRLFDFAIRVDGRGRGQERGKNLYSANPIPLPIFYHRAPPGYKFISLPSLPLPLKSNMAAIRFVMKLLSTRSPKLRLLFGLRDPSYRQRTRFIQSESGSKAYTIQNYTSIELSNIKNIRLDNGVICD